MAEYNSSINSGSTGDSNINLKQNINKINSNNIKYRAKISQNRYKRHSGGALFLIEQTIRNSIHNDLKNYDLHKSKSTSSINDENKINKPSIVKSKSDISLNKSKRSIEDMKEDKTFFKVIKSAKISAEVYSDPLRNNRPNLADNLINNDTLAPTSTEIYTSTPNSNRSVDIHPLDNTFSTIHKYGAPGHLESGSQSSSPTSTPSEITMTSNSDFPHQPRNYFHVLDVSNIKIPIVGYEVMEERARFTVYKLRILTGSLGETWLVLRRYTDFVRLYNRLKLEFPTAVLPLPRKKWFGDNFNRKFLQDRVQGLQNFIDSVLSYNFLIESQTVKEFFCLNEPPGYSESMEDSRALFEAQEETILQLRKELHKREEILSDFQSKLTDEVEKNRNLQSVIKSVEKNCPNCSVEVNKIMKFYKNTAINVKENTHCRNNRQVHSK